MNNKTTLIVLIIILVSLITFLGGYIVAQKNNDQTANIANLNRFNFNDSQSNNIQTVHPQGLIRLSTVKALGPTISENGKSVLYFEKNSGKILSSDFSGQNVQPLSGIVIENLLDASWAGNGYEAIIKTRSEKKKNFYLNIKNKKVAVLGQNISAISWSKDSQKIAYLYFDPLSQAGNISIADPDGSSFKNIIKTRAGNLKILWVKDNLVSFYNPAEQSSSLLLLNTEIKALDKLFDPLENLDILWSPDGSHLLYSYQDSGAEKTALLNLSDKIEIDIDLATKASKCVWTLDSLKIYCGGKKDPSQDEAIYRLDLNKKEFGLVFQPSATDSINIENPILTPIEDTLIFTNIYDGYLYSVGLH